MREDASLIRVVARRSRAAPCFVPALASRLLLARSAHICVSALDKNAPQPAPWRTFPLRVPSIYAARRSVMVADGYNDAKPPPEPGKDLVDLPSVTATPLVDESAPLIARDASEDADSDGPNIRVLLAVVAAVVVFGSVAVAAGTGVLSPDSLVSLASWFESRGPSAVLLYSIFYFVLELVAVPALPLTLGSGYLFGVPIGTALVSVASTAAATASFLISRYGLRDYISGVATKYPRFRAMDRAIGREGFKFVFLLRLSPLLPFSISSYLYGLTSVNLQEYVLGSWLGMLPGTIAYVSAGAALSALTDISETKHTVNPYLVGIGLAATIGVLFFIGRLAANAVEAEGDFNESV